MILYNTATRKVEELVPQKSPHLSVYTCGPTVYDYPHIGNWFTFIRYDILVRALKATGLKPKWIMNITDVGHLVSDADEGEDKLEKGAKREGKTAWQIAEYYADYFVKGLDRLNITEPEDLPKATDHIKEQIDLIEKLEKKKFTYQITDGVYFDTAKLKDYGKLAQLDIENLKAGARVEENPEKRNPTDFALWKISPKDQRRDMEWDSPWGTGFPGWHIECSAMSMKYLGETLDLHGGGIDHIPVHHTNEIAQSETATGRQFVRHWFHANHILINDEKIAKSAGNGVTLEDIESKGFPLMALRLLVLESHYRTQSTFSWETLAAAGNRLQSLQAMADLRWQAVTSANNETKAFKYAQDEILGSLENDLDTPKVLATLSALQTTLMNTLISKTDLSAFVEFLKFIDVVLGLKLSETHDIDAKSKKLIHEREEARQKQNWQESDRLRLELEKNGLGVRDTDHGTIWFRL